MALKVLLGHNTYQNTGGEDTSFEHDLEVLRSNGHEVVTFLRDNREIESYGPADRVRLAAGTVWSRRTYRELSQLLERERPDVAHFQNTFPLISPSAYAACNDAGVPVVQTVQNFRLTCLNAFLFRDGHICEDCVGRTPWPGVIHRCYRGSAAGSAVVATMLVVHRAARTWERRVDLYLTPSAFGKEKLIEGGVPADRIALRPNFLESDPGARPPSTHGDYFLFAGRLSPEKGLATIVKAVADLPDVPLKIVGGGPLRDSLDRTIRSEGLANVEMVGLVPRPQVAELMRGARAVLVPSEWYELAPLVFLEGMAVGAPFLASDLPASHEVIGDAGGGIFVRPGDVSEWTRWLRWAWDHPAEMAEHGVKARATFEARYTAARGYETLMDAYAIAQKNAAARKSRRRSPAR